MQRNRKADGGFFGSENRIDFIHFEEILGKKFMSSRLCQQFFLLDDDTTPKTNVFPLKNDGWMMNFLLKWSLF